jgi:hypothetical protein
MMAAHDRQPKCLKFAEFGTKASEKRRNRARWGRFGPSPGWGMQIGAMRGWQTGVTISFPVTIMKRLPMHVLRPIPKCGRLHFMIPETFDIDRPRPIHGLSLRAIFFMLSLLQNSRGGRDYLILG